METPSTHAYIHEGVAETPEITRSVMLPGLVEPDTALPDQANPLITGEHSQRRQSAKRPQHRGSLGGYEEHSNSLGHKLTLAPSALRSEILQTGCAAEPSYRTAPEGTMSAALTAPSLSPEDSVDEDSRTEGLHKHGVVGAPPASWTTANGGAQSWAADQSVLTSQPNDITASERSEIRQSSHISALGAAKLERIKRPKSTGSDICSEEPARRPRSAPAVPQRISDQPKAHVPDNGTLGGSFEACVATTNSKNETPFRFYKRKSKGDAPNRSAGSGTWRSTKSTKSRKPVSFPSQEVEQAGRRLVAVSTTIKVRSAEAPVLDVSFGASDSFGPRLQLALEDEHLNTILPSTRTLLSTGEPWSVKRALKCAMRESGAEFECIPGEPASSQLDTMDGTHAVTRQSAHDFPQSPAGAEKGKTGEEATSGINRLDEQPTPRTQLPDTQVMLAQARFDFFNSPEKQMTAAAGAAEGLFTSVEDDVTMQSQTVSHQPLQELSQQPLPATQALIDAWSPWSHIKKPIGRLTQVTLITTPTGVSKSVGKQSTAADDAVRRRNSSRFATTFDDPPSQPSRLDFPITKESSSAHGPKNLSQSGHDSAPKFILKSSGRRHDAHIVGSPHHGTPGPEAQESVPKSLDIPSVVGAGSALDNDEPRTRTLFREESQVERAIDDLEATVLSFTGDLDAY
ncbi:hypothetical protein BAUCODRAFT_28073 [Baudoinia panamericana UAMH 10762]|uniref:Uncharacterized protein n=1 Tax=Baudoinia panamericana (strain UAMH 10762) TaxID=717646 RepID=M2M5D4_BAUPA|nr:uncharacterized protein BAUCODRAFT_28073 [Baudoinia panamericana UAMH 10762]EMC91836.1 hypothetical protein BAUCODRAFT_28073 [Baudoinia panamericana UAMH 10762]